MKIKFDEELGKKLTKILGYSLTGLYEIQDITGIIEDLICEYNHLEEEFEDYKEDVADNYKQILYRD